jgi:hypothetical protein
MASQVLMVCDRTTAVIQPGQPPAQMGAWLLDVPDGGDPLAVAAAFADSVGFPIGTTARVIVDLSGVQIFKLTSQWVAE